MRFSDLSVEFHASTNRLYDRVERLRSQKAELLDLVRGNPQDGGILFPADILREILMEAAEAARIYRPDSLGQPAARRAVAAYTGSNPEHVLLTPGTSVSYWYVFRLLAEPGDEILCPTPGYPLFDYIARMSGVELGHYRLDESADWRIDFGDLEQRIRERTRAIVLISPHNPTGMVADPAQLSELARLARKHDLAIISDEVFREFTFGGPEAPSPAGTGAPLVFALNGFSKMFALPGMKVGWISVSGDGLLVNRAMRALEMISDTFLPVNELAQFAVPGIFERGQTFLSGYRKSVTSARDTAVELLGPRAGNQPQGGFYLVLPVEREIDEEDLAIELLEEESVLTHPGYFYDIEGRHLVLSFVGGADRVRTGISRIVRHLDKPVS